MLEQQLDEVTAECDRLQNLVDALEDQQQQQHKGGVGGAGGGGGGAREGHGDDQHAAKLRSELDEAIKMVR
eukprot:56990-Chlamydomonas_euryale.AAC.1